MTLRWFVFGTPQYVPATPWTAPWAVLAAVAVLVFSQPVASVVVPWLADRLPAAAPQNATSVTVNGAVLLLWLLCTQAVVVMLVLLASQLFGGRAKGVLKLGAVDGGARSIVYAVLLMAVLLGSLNAVFYWLLQSDMLKDMQQYLTLVRAEPWVLSVLTIGVGAPLMEEFLFRGFLLSALARGRLGFPLGALLVTAAWTALHWGYSAIGLLEVFVIGLYFSWLLWRTGSLWPALICHALYNTALVLVLRLVPLPV
jgi:membrane protease YdiL (CAAX protease family)